MKVLLLSVLAAVLAIGPGTAEQLTLTNKEGVTIVGRLLERREDGVTVKVGANTYDIPYDRLEPDTVAKLKAAEIMERVSTEVRIDVDIKKSGEIKKSGRVRVDDFGNVDDTTGSYRTDTIGGKVTITNRNSRDATAPGTLKVVILKRQDRKVVEMHSQSFDLELPLDALESRTFDLDETMSTHSAKGMVDIGNKPQGRYVGYIAAFMVDGEMVAIKSLPGSYERDPDEAELFLNGKNGEADKNKGGNVAGPGRERELDGPGKKRVLDGPGGN